MIFKTFNSDIDKISSKWGMFGKSFNDIGAAIIGRITDINKAFQATDDLIGSIKDSDSIWKRLYPSKETINENLIDVASLYPERTDSQFSSLLSNLVKIEEKVKSGNGSWQKYFNGLGEGEKWQIEFVQNTDLQKASLSDVKNAYDSARASALAHNEAIKAQTFSAKAGKVALQALATVGNMFIGWAITKGIELAVTAIDNYIHRVEKANEAMQNAVSDYESAKSSLESVNSELEEQNVRLNELLAKDKLTYAEKGELEELQAITQELLLQQDIEERRAAKASKDVADKTVDAYKKQYGRYDLSKEEVERQLNYTNFPMPDGEDDIIGNITSYLRAKDAYKEAQQELIHAQQNGEDTTWIDSDIQGYIDLIDAYSEDLDNNISDLQEKRLALEDEYNKAIEKREAGTEPLTTSDKDVIKTYESIYDSMKMIYEYTNQNDWNNMQIESIFNTEGIEKTKEELIEMAKAGELTPETISSYKNLNNAIEESEIFLKDGQTAIQAFCDEMIACADATENIGDEFSNIDISLSLPDAQKLVNGLKDGETETLGLIDELSLLQEILSDTGNIQQETYAKLLSCSSKYSAAIRTENGRITLNTTKLKQVAKSRQLDTQETIKQTIALMKQNWLQWANNIDNYNGTLLESITSKYNDIDALQNEITQYELLANSVNEASNAFENFKTAQSTNDQDMYDTAQEAFNILKEYTSDTESSNYGKYNRDEFQEAVMLLMDTDTYRKAINAKDLEEYQKIVTGFVKTLDPLFDEKNYNSAANLFDRIEEIMNSGDVPEADKDWAKRLGISEETFHALSQLGNLYDFNGKEIFESYQLNTLDNYYEKLQAVKSAKDALNAIEDKDTNAYIRQEDELNRLTESYNTFVNDTAQKVSQAFADFQQNPEGKSFADYLKESFDFDDNDITGSLMAIIDKSGDLQKTLDSISLNEVVQSQQEEYQELQNLNQIISTLNENGYSSVDVEVKNKSNFNEIYNEYEKLRQKVLEYQEAISNSDNPHEINELNGYLSECVSNMDKLREPLRIEIEANIERVNSQLESVKSKINELNSQTSLSPYQQERLGVLQGEQAALESQQATLEAQLKIVVDSTDVDDYKPEDKEGTVSYSPDFSQVESAVPPTLNGTVKYTAVIDTSGLAGSLGGFPQTSSGTSSTSNTGASLNGGSHAKGTVGNAFANGYNGLPANEKNALRSEYGQKEMTVYPDGRYEITETPTLSDLPKGTVIFNEKQTNRILKGISHFKGTVGKAFGTGTKVNLINLTDVMSNNSAIAGSRNNNKSGSNSDDSSSSSSSNEAQEATEEFFDWIERRIKKFQALFDKWIKQAETAVTSGFINKYYKKAVSAIKNELSTYGKAYKRYMKQADSIGLSKKYRDKVKNGTIDIESIKDEKLAEQIKKYQEWCVNTPLYLVTGGGILFNC